MNQKRKNANQILVPLKSALGRKLTWRQPETFVYTWELYAGDGLVGVLSYHGWWKEHAEWRLFDQTWTFARKGFFKQRVEISQQGGFEQDLIFQPNLFWQGVLETHLAPPVMWKNVNFWAMNWAFVDESNLPLIEFGFGLDRFRLRDIFRTQATVQISARAGSRPDLGLLLGLGWYLMILRRQQSASAAAAGAGH